MALKQRSLRQMSTAVTIAGLIPMAVLLAIMVYRGQLTARQEARADLRGVTTALSSQFELVVAGAEDQFQELSGVKEIQSGNREVCETWLAKNLPAKPGIDAWFRLTPDGQVTCSSRSIESTYWPEEVFDPSDAGNYGAVRVHPSRISRSTGKAIFSMSRAYKNDGDPYLLIVSLDVEWFYNAVMALAPFEDDARRIFLLGDMGEILFRLPDYQTVDLGSVPYFERSIVPDKIPRILTIPQGVDGTLRLASNVTIHTFADAKRVFLTVSSNPDALYADAQSFVVLGFGTLVFAVLGVIFAQQVLFAKFLAQPIEKITQFATNAARDGTRQTLDLPPSAPFEISQIADAITSMITEKDDRAASLSEALHNLELAQDIARMGYWRIDLKKNELFWSDGVFRLHGLDRETFTPNADKAVELYHRDDRADVKSALDDAIRTQTPFSFEKRICKADGTFLYVSARGLVSFDRAGEPSAIFGIIIDIDAPKQAQRELKRAQVASQQLADTRAAFLASVSHEVRTPLAAMLGIVDGFRGQNLSDEQIEQIDLLDASGQMLLNVISDLLDSASGDAGTLRLVETPTHIPALMESCYQTFKLLQQRPEIDFRYSQMGTPPEAVFVDGQRLKQVIFNLLSNAFKHTEKGSVTLTAAYKDSALEIIVEDTGAGISPTVHHKLFERFSQLGDAKTERGRGTGLGLYIVKTMVLAMGGDVRVRSAVGKGSAFTVSMPLKSNIEGAAGPAPSEAHRPARNYVLLVEDNPINQKLLISFLKKMKCAYVVHDDGQSALEWLLTCAPEDYPALALIDVNMPRLNGIELCEFIRKQLPCGDDIPLYLVTADVLADHESAIAALAIEGCISKPVDFVELRRVLNVYIDADKAVAPAA